MSYIIILPKLKFTIYRKPYIAAHYKVNTNQNSCVDSRLSENQDVWALFVVPPPFMRTHIAFALFFFYLVSFYDFHLRTNTLKLCCVDLNTDHFMAPDTLMGRIYRPICLFGAFPLPLLALSWTSGFNHHQCNCHFVLQHVCRTLTHYGLIRKFCPIKPDCGF